MRVLVVSSPGTGHLLPLLPLARAAVAAGHDVVVAAGASLATTVRDTGLRHAEVGPPSIGAVVAGIPGREGLTGRRLAVTIFRHGFCGPIAAGMADGIVALARDWRPDVIVCEDMAFGAWIASDVLGVPHVTVQATAWRPRMRDLAQEPLNDLRSRHGLHSDPELGGLYGRIFFATRPGSLRDPDAPYPPDARDLRPVADDRRPSDPPDADPFPRRDGRPRVAVTLGTINAGQVPVLRALMEGAAATGADVVVAAGADPASLGPTPARVDARAWVPMSALAASSDVIAFHGGSGTMMTAAAAGTPMVIVPLAADQPDNADRCAAAGIAAVVPLETVQPSAVTTAIDAVLADGDIRRRAGDIAAEIAAMPGPETAIRLVEEVAG